MPGSGVTADRMSWPLPGPRARPWYPLPPRLGRRGLRLTVGGHRRVLAGALAAVAAVLAVAALRPAAPAGVAVLVAARDLRPGVPVGAADLRGGTLPPAAVPAGVLRPGSAVVGRLLASPVRRGEALTDVRFVGPGLLPATAGAAGLVAAPVRIADPGAAALLHPGDRVDVLAAATDGAAGHAGGGGDAGGAGAAGAVPPAGTVAVVAERAQVLAVPRPDDTGPVSGGEGALVVLATPRSVAADLARAAVTSRLSVTVRGP